MPGLAVARLGKFLTTALQLVLLLLVIRSYHIEEASGFLSITSLIFIGFLIHAALPLRYRQAFFLSLSFAAFFILLGLSAVLLIAFGLALIGTCHLPIAFRWRILLLGGLGTVIAALRVNWIAGASQGVASSRMLSVLGSMFMFRLIIYLYDLRHERATARVWQRLSYFFLLPNVCFPLFPVVDYQAFRRAYYPRDALEIYQKGIRWIVRGLSHLLVYRIVYYYLAPSPSAISGLTDVLLFLVSAWLLFLHVSGVFHLAIGILCLFGFDLPESNYLYFLASSPNEIWRRANIYWKDFMMKIFYYPLYKRMYKRKLGVERSLVIATLGVFVATWLLHSYQWFWILGKFPFDSVDAIFWTVFAALVLGNTIWELRRPKKRLLGAHGWSATQALIRTAKVMGTFMLMCVMWSWWTTRNTDEWLSILAVAGHGGPGPFGALALVLVCMLGAGTLIQYVISAHWNAGFPWNGATYNQSTIVTVLAAVALLSAGGSAVQRRAGPRAGAFLKSLQTERLNDRDAETQQRGYYESLMKTDQLSLEISQPRLQQLKEGENIRTSSAVRQTNDELEYELIPSRETIFKGALLRTNSWGMRDKPYELKKPSGTLRIALVGGSITMGSGVTNEETYEALVEDRLNRERSGGKYSRYEILNFAVGGYGLLQQRLIVRDKVFRFEPDILVYATHPEEERRSLDVITRQIIDNVQTGRRPSPVLAEIQHRSGIERGMARGEIRRRLRSGRFAEEFQALIYREIVGECVRRNVIPVWLLVPTLGGGEADPKMADVARRAGFVLLTIGEAYRGQNEADLVIAANDFHPNAKGHRLLADYLYRSLLENDAVLGLGLKNSRR